MNDPLNRLRANQSPANYAHQFHVPVDVEVRLRIALAAAALADRHHGEVDAGLLDPPVVGEAVRARPS